MSNERLARLKRKVEDFDLPDEDVVPGASWDYGVPLSWIKEMKKFWLNQFDWKAAEKSINRFDHFKVTIEGISVHFIHQRSSRPDAVPIILFHGWPGSFFEFNQVIEPLNNPDDPSAQDFHVVVPSLPGFGFSSPPKKQEWTVKDNARIFDVLMQEVLGYEAYVAQGGDWGSQISTHLSNHPSCKLVHFNNMAPIIPRITPLLGFVYFALPSRFSNPILKWYFSPREFECINHTIKLLKHGSGYLALQSTQPTKIGYALNDSPMGLLIYIGEIYQLFVDPEDTPYTPEFLITTICIYWFTQSFVSSCLPYRENYTLNSGPSTKIKNALLGVSTFPKDLWVMPKRWVRGMHPGLIYHKEHERGGHFAAMESPKELVEDLREFVGANLAALKG